VNTPNAAPYRLLPVVKVALLCACASVPLAIVNELLCIAPLGVFIGCCLAAPFFPRMGFYLPVISRGMRETNQVALTFDDGPDPATTPLLLKLLSRHKVTATFFVIGRKAERHPDLMRGIIAAGHAIGNHSCSHDVLLMLRSSQRLYEEIAGAQKVLQHFGCEPWAFRPPAGITNPRLGRVLRRLGLSCVTFSCRAFDGGNRHIAGLADTILGKVKGGDIILLHDVQPSQQFMPEAWIREIEQIVAGLHARHFSIVPLAELAEAGE
jgi:peptidoglycan/xylan/chitin deacetylase (PgdA/CDA1 family)